MTTLIESIKIDRTMDPGEAPLRARGECDWCKHPELPLELYHDPDGDELEYICLFCRHTLAVPPEQRALSNALCNGLNAVMTKLDLIVRKKVDPKREGPTHYVVGAVQPDGKFHLLGGPRGIPFITGADNQLDLLEITQEHASMYRVSPDGAHIVRITLPTDPLVPHPPPTVSLSSGQQAALAKALRLIDERKKQDDQG